MFGPALAFRESLHATNIMPDAGAHLAELGRCD
jgi:hypothetical protein